MVYDDTTEGNIKLIFYSRTKNALRMHKSRDHSSAYFSSWVHLSEEISPNPLLFAATTLLKFLILLNNFFSQTVLDHFNNIDATCDWIIYTVIPIMMINDWIMLDDDDLYQWFMIIIPQCQLGYARPVSWLPINKTHYIWRISFLLQKTFFQDICT